MDGKLIKLIVECDISPEYEAMISALCRVKYSLPAIGCYVVEVGEENYPLIAGLDGIKAVHSTACITAQEGDAGPLPQLYNDFRGLGYTGKGVGIAVLDTGVGRVRDLCRPRDRITAFKDFIGNLADPYDDNAHGTHVAGIAAGNGVSSGGRYAGVAPDGELIGVKILDGEGKGDTAEVLAGIQWVIDNMDTFNIRVMNLSIGMTDQGSDAPLVKAVEAAWDRGVVVCVAAGNNGPGKNTVTSPGISRKVITVGSSEDEVIGSWQRLDY